MNWSDERYVRLYTRDTPDWQCLSFLAQGLFCLLLRKVDRAGVIHLGKTGRKGAAIAVGHAHQWVQLEPALDELLADGCVRIEGDLLVLPNFLDAQEALASDAARAKKAREVRRDLAKAGRKPESRGVTSPAPVSDSRDGGDTRCDAGITGCDQTVTPSLAKPSEPNRTVLPMPASRRAGEQLRLGPLSTELRRRVETGLNHGLIPCGQADADELERLIAHHGGMEPAIGFVAATIRKRDADPQSMAWLLTVLRPSTNHGARQ